MLSYHDLCHSCPKHLEPKLITMYVIIFLLLVITVVTAYYAIIVADEDLIKNFGTDIVSII